MTRERKLAIKMWEEVKKQLPEWYEENQGDIVADLKYFKATFCFQNNLRWKYNCWFCQYIRLEQNKSTEWNKHLECTKCPLRSCNHRNPLTAWARLVDEDNSLEIRIAACDEIIAALKGGVK